MSRELLMLSKDKGSWFLREPLRQNPNEPGYPIYYKFAISCSMAQHFFKNRNKNGFESEIQSLINGFESEIRSLIDALKSSKEYIGEMIKVHPLAGTERGFVLVDRTDSWYPLLIYTDKSREYAMVHSLEEILSVLSSILGKLAKLNSIDDWNEQFQEELFDLFPTNKKKSGR